MNSADTQRQAFLTGEADRYYERNPLDFEASLADPWNLHLASLVPPGGRVLEVGCSDGRRLAAIGALVERAERNAPILCGVDPSQNAVGTGMSRWGHLDLRVGTSDHLPFDEPFDLVLFGFCLYLCDRSLLFRSIAEADRLTSDRGWLAIIDFDPPIPSRRQYHHLPGIWSWKMHYPSLFLANPAYQLADKFAGSQEGAGWEDTSTERVAMWALRKMREHAYILESG